MNDLQRQGTGGAVAMPALTGEQMISALKGYKELQGALDAAMPDQIMQLDGKAFRKKGYWRAIALAFNLTVEPIQERREVSGHFKDGRENFGWAITYRAQGPNGRQAFGDGSCFAVEKARRFRCPHPDPQQPNNPRRTEHFPHNTCPDFDPDFQWRSLSGDATEHNVRSHAHTRAFNRAVSNLVGFGEVSAEEVQREEHGREDVGEVVKSAGSGSTASAAVEPSADGRTHVKDVTIKTGKNSRGTWARYDVTFEDGRRAGTFSKSIGEHAQRAKASGAAVNPTIEKTDKGNTLSAFEAVTSTPAAAPAPAHPDEPVAGPETILTVRATDTAHGQRWVIQTSKRQVVAADEALATQATEARKAKVGLVPIFEVVPVDKGGSFNRLTNWQIAESAPVEGEVRDADR